MDDEFKLCWKNFQDNIATGFQSLFDRGDLVDVTLACDGKLLQAHKFVLAICSPYFQEIFISNPCKHPIIILKDVSYNIMCELLEFMYQGVVNVKHTELQSFMKIGQLLQIKGLATNSSSAASTNSDISTSNNQANTVNEETSFTEKTLTSSNENTGNEGNSNIYGEKQPTPKDTPQRSQSPLLSPAASPMQTNLLNNTNQVNNKLNNSQLSVLQSSSHGNGTVSGHKRHIDFNSDTLSVYSRNKLRRSITSTDLSSENTDGPDGSSVNSNVDQMNTEDFFLPHISMVESRYELNNIKRESSEHHQNSSSASAAAVAAASLRNSFNSAAFGLDYTFYKNNNASSQSSQEYPNELHMSNEYSKTFANHMDIPPNCPNVVMLSSTSLLHGNCVFNRNNTVATQQGMKTYWLCKSYRISMCRARCITHQGKIISATGVHNHAPHMRGNNNTSNSGNSGSIGSGNSGSTAASINHNTALTTSPHPSNNSSLRYSQNSGASANSNHHNYHEHQHPLTPPPQQHSQSFSAHSHVHHDNSNNNAVVPPPHLFLQSMPNLLVQHFPNGQSAHGMQQTSFPTQHHNALHTYEISPTMQPSPSDEHTRTTNSSFNENDKSLSSINKSQLNDDHIILQNAAALSPSNVQNSSIKTGHDESLTHQNDVGKQLSSVEHHQVQVIDSVTISPVGPGEHWFQGKLEFMLSQRGKPLLVHDGHTFGIQYVRKDKKYWQCNLSRKFNCKARVTTTDTGEIIVTNNEHCHTEIRQHLRKDYQRNKVMMNALINLSTNRLAVENFRRHNSIANNLSNLQSIVAAAASTPLNLQSSIEGTSSTGNIFNLSKRPISTVESNQLHQYEHNMNSPSNKIDEENCHDEPLDCGIKSSFFKQIQNEDDILNAVSENNDKDLETQQLSTSKETKTLI